MDLRELDLNLLLVFDEVLRAGQVSEAAKRLKLTQSAVSNALARLRRTTGDELFVRTTAGMQPTPYAARMAGPVAVALAHLERAFLREAAFDPATSHTRFTIAMTDVGEAYFMPKLIAACAMRAPQLTIASVRAGLLDLRVEMEAGRVDLAIGAFEDAPNVFYQRRLFAQSYVVMFRAGHPLLENEITLQCLSAARHLIINAMESPYEDINRALEQAGIDLDASFRVSHFAAVPFVLSTTDLVATVPQKLAEQAAADFDLAFVTSPLHLPALQTNIFWHRRYHQDTGNQWLRAMVAEVFGE